MQTKTYPNSKEIPSNLMYDLIKNSFSEFASDALKKKTDLRYGIAGDSIQLEKEDGTRIYRIDVSREVITLVPLSTTEQLIGNELDKFIQSCLL